MIVVLPVAVVCVLAVAGIFLAGWLSNRPERPRHRDPFDGYGLTVNAATPEGFDGWEMPPEIAHEWPGQPGNNGRQRAGLAGRGTSQLPPVATPGETSPDGEVPAPAPAREPEPGTAAAADVDPTPPGPVPPPLPDDTLAGLAAVAAIRDQLAQPADEERWPWLAEGQYADDTGSFAAIVDGA